MIQQQLSVNDLIESSIEVNQSILGQFENLLEQLENIEELPDQIKEVIEGLLRSMVQSIQESLEILHNLQEQYQTNEKE